MKWYLIDESELRLLMLYREQVYAAQLKDENFIENSYEEFKRKRHIESYEEEKQWLDSEIWRGNMIFGTWLEMEEIKDEAGEDMSIYSSNFRIRR